MRSALPIPLRRWVEPGLVFLDHGPALVKSTVGADNMRRNRCVALGTVGQLDRPHSIVTAPLPFFRLGTVSLRYSHRPSDPSTLPQSQEKGQDSRTCRVIAPLAPRRNARSGHPRSDLSEKQADYPTEIGNRMSSNRPGRCGLAVSRVRLVRSFVWDFRVHRERFDRSPNSSGSNVQNGC